VRPSVQGSHAAHSAVSSSTGQSAARRPVPRSTTSCRTHAADETRLRMHVSSVVNAINRAADETDH
jgi:hypothetical protein